MDIIFVDARAVVRYIISASGIQWDLGYKRKQRTLSRLHAYE
jgi:hypothetical protein